MDSIIDEFKNKYGYVNDKNLIKCAKEDSEFLLRFIKGPIKRYTKACSIVFLSYSENDKYLDLFKKWTKDDDTMIAEAGYMALNNYFQNDEVKYRFLYDYVKEMSLLEKRNPVFKKITGILEFMEMYL